MPNTHKVTSSNLVRNFFFIDIVSERLRRWTANPLGYARAGSNPADVAFGFLGQAARRRSRKPKIASSNLAETFETYYGVLAQLGER